MDKFTKYITSFFKKDWKLEDYPTLYTRPNPDNVKAGLVSGDIWIASIKGWPGIVGMSKSKQSALIELESAFNTYKNSGAKLPRPGTNKKIEIASTEGIDEYYETFCSFCRGILDFDPETVFVSDESSLWDFSITETLDDYYNKISQNYGVDVSDIEDGNILKILIRIKQKVLTLIRPPVVNRK